jgi:adenine-specific DNA methylase
MTYRKKLIEVSLPLEAINVASAREKSIRHGHPSTSAPYQREPDFAAVSVNYELHELLTEAGR